MLQLIHNLNQRHFTKDPRRPENPVDFAESKLFLTCFAGLGIFYRKIPTLHFVRYPKSSLSIRISLSTESDQVRRPLETYDFLKKIE